MEEIAESIGRLSTNAKEWKPGMAYSSTSTSTSISSPNKYNQESLSLSSPSRQKSSSSSFTSFSPSTRYSLNSNVRNAPPSDFIHHNPFRPQQQENLGSHYNVPGILPNYRNDSNDDSMLSSAVSDTSSQGKNWRAMEFVPSNNTNIHSTTSHEHTCSTNPLNSNTNIITTATVVPSAPPPARLTSSKKKNLYSLGLPDTQWSFYRALAIESLREMEPTDPRHKAVPASFSHAFPLDHKTNTANTTATISTNTAPHSSSNININTNNASFVSTGSSSFGYPSSVFKVLSKEDGQLYCLRRLDNVKCVSRKFAVAVTERWTNATSTSNLSYASTTTSSTNATANATTGITRGRRTGGAGGLRNPRTLMDHPGICRFYKCFVSARAVFFLHSYHPGAITLKEQFLDPEPPLLLRQPPYHLAATAASAPLLQEGLLWSFVVQLVSVLRAIHGNNLACRCLQSNHILCTSDDGERLRIRINCIGVVDALEFETRKPITHLKQEDMRCLGRIILSLATRTNIGPNTDGEKLQHCQLFVAQHYSNQLHSLVMALLFSEQQHTNNRVPSTNSNNLPNIFEVSAMIAQHAFDELDDSHAIFDGTSQRLSREYESGRALRLLLKLGFVNERPEFGMDTRWSETGDCYVLKLFRDYVFHQADVNGQPMMDLGHVVTALNKLDTADPEKIVLASRDGKSLLVVSFADVARCLEGAYEELCAHYNAATEGRSVGSLAYG